MGDRARRGFRPGVERVEGRDLAAGGLGTAWARHFAQVEAFQIRAEARRPQFPPAGRPGIGPGLGGGLVRLALPYNYLDYGVVTLWNNTPGPVTIGVSASTYNPGTYLPFTILSGQNRSFYAPAVGPQLPVFSVSFGAGSVPVVLPQDNVVFESRGYFPAGTAGFPYAVNFGVNGYYISLI